MGAGRRTETYLLGSSRGGVGSGSDNLNSSYGAQFLCLPKKDLAAVVFGCTHSTVKECLSNQLFGLPAAHINYVQNIEPGMPLFLFNYDDRTMQGIYEATSHGGLNYNMYAWTEGGTGKTSYPAQVRVTVREHCLPLTEKVYRSIITDNYYTKVHFHFELNEMQTTALINAFKSCCEPSLRTLRMTPSKGSAFSNGSFAATEEDDSWVKPKKSFKSNFAPWSNFSHQTSSSSVVINELPFDTTLDKVEQSQRATSTGKQQSVTVINKSTLNNTESSKLVCPLKLQELPQDLEKYAASSILEERKAVNGKTGLENVLSSCEGNVENTKKMDRELVLEKLRKLKSSMVDSSSLQGQEMNENKNNGNSNIHDLGEPDWEAMARERCMNEQIMLREEREKVWGILQVADLEVAKSVQKHLEFCATAVAQMRQESLEWKRAKQEQLDELANLRREKNELERTQVQMSSQLQKLDYEMSRVLSFLDRKSSGQLMTEDSSVEANLMANSAVHPGELESAIHLLGGYNGEFWLGSVDKFFPSSCQLQPVAPMWSPRSYAAACVLMDQIYVFGGGDGVSWYETAEAYNSQTNEWTALPPMSTKRGSLAGATVGDRIFALGGGNGQVHFSEVECYDPYLGAWIPSTSMIHTRFCVGAAELGGALYAVGGFDRSYLRSVERFDPREALWTAVAPMINKRGSLSVAVLNEKLYAIGGYSGSEFWNNVEVYDPRANRWLELEGKMSTERIYGAAAVLDGALYVIGGLDRTSSVNTVECYSEKNGWKVVDSSTIGYRSFLAAVVLP